MVGTYLASYLILAWVELAAGQLEESGAQLEEEHVGQPVLVHQQHPIHRPSHTELIPK